MSAEADHFERAMVFHEHARYEDALRELECHFHSDPNGADAHYLAGSCHFRLGRFAESEAHLKRAVAVNPELEWAFYFLASIHLKTIRIEKARSAIEAALRINPDSPEALSVLAMVEELEGKREKALATLDHGLAIDPKNNDCLLRKAALLADQGSHKNAIKLLETALQIAPENANAYCLMAQLKSKDGQYKEAVDYYLETLRIRPDWDLARKGAVSALCSENPCLRVAMLGTPLLWNLDQTGRQKIGWAMFCLWVAAFTVVAWYLPNWKWVGLWTLPLSIKATIVYLIGIILRPFAFLALHTHDTGRKLVQAQDLNAGLIWIGCLLVTVISIGFWYVEGDHLGMALSLSFGHFLLAFPLGVSKENLIRPFAWTMVVSTGLFSCLRWIAGPTLQPFHLHCFFAAFWISLITSYLFFARKFRLARRA